MTILQEIQKIPTIGKIYYKTYIKDNSEKSQNFRNFLEKQRQDFEVYVKSSAFQSNIYCFSKFN